MNQAERKMLDLLRRGYHEYGFRSVRAEFEAEGTRPDDLLRLLELGYKAGLNLTIKIGGCEAVRDLMDAKQLGASTIIAPMIESVYALEKFIGAIHRVFPTPMHHLDEGSPAFYFNIETLQAYLCHKDLIKRAENVVNGIVFGRVDFVTSQGKPRSFVEDKETLEKVIVVAKACQQRHLQYILGGGICMDSIPHIQQVAKVHLNFFETRKISLDTKEIKASHMAEGLRLAIQFELLWLKNKQDYYTTLQNDDVMRIRMLTARLADPS